MENGPGVSLPGYLLICYSQQAVSISLQMKNCSLTQQTLSRSQRRSIQSAQNNLSILALKLNLIQTIKFVSDLFKLE